MNKPQRSLLHRERLVHVQTAPVAGLGDRSAGAGRTGGVLGGHQPEERADRAPRQPFPLPASTANPNEVSVETPRRHPGRVATGVYGLSAAITAITSSCRSRRPTAATTAAYAMS